MSVGKKTKYRSLTDKLSTRYRLGYLYLINVIFLKSTNFKTNIYMRNIFYYIKSVSFSKI